VIRPEADWTAEQYLDWWASQPIEFRYYVYVIQGEPHSPVKIGLAKDVRTRIASLQTGNPTPLRLLYVLMGGQDLEWELHRKFGQYRIPRSEWFEAAGTEALFPWLERLRDAQVAAYGGGTAFPSVRSLKGFSWLGSNREQVTIRLVEPTPVSPEEAAERLKQAWMNPDTTRAAPQRRKGQGAQCP
jgi:hypothetical protein